MERRPPPQACSRVPEWQTRREMGLGQRQTDEGFGVAETSEAHQRSEDQGPAMKIRRASSNNRRKVFEVSTAKGKLVYPYAKSDPRPTADDPIAGVRID